MSVGKKLREAREKKSLTIEQVQKQTKIHSTVLVALEEGRASEILTDTYVRSFIKKYAQLLGLSAQEILKEYFPAYPDSPVSPAPIHEKTVPKETAASPKFLYMTGIAIIFVIAAAFLIFITGRVADYIKKPHASKQNTQSKSAAAPVKKKATKTTDKKTTSRKVSAKSANTQKEIVPKGASLSLVITVKDPVLVKLKKDGIVIFERVLTKPLIETVVANEKIELEIGDARALDLSLNGRPIQLPEKKKMINLEITRKGVRLR